MDDCPICEKHRGSGPLVGPLLYEDEDVFAYHAPPSAVDGYAGYLFVETRRHVRGLAELSPDEAAAAGRLVARLAKALEQAGAEHVYAFVFDHIPHHHEHVVARHPRAPPEYRGTSATDWPDAPRGEIAIEALCERVREALQSASR